MTTRMRSTRASQLEVQLRLPPRQWRIPQTELRVTVLLGHQVLGSSQGRERLVIPENQVVVRINREALCDDLSASPIDGTDGRHVYAAQAAQALHADGLASTDELAVGDAAGCSLLRVSYAIAVERFGEIEGLTASSDAEGEFGWRVERSGGSDTND